MVAGDDAYAFEPSEYKSELLSLGTSSSLVRRVDDHLAASTGATFLLQEIESQSVSDVYRMCMSRTNIELDDAACAVVMKRFNLTTKRDAVNFALNVLACEAMSLDEARSMRGSGWVGDLNTMRGIDA